MPFQRQRPQLQICPEDRSFLETIARSRTESSAWVSRAKILLAYHDGKSVSAIARELGTNRPKIERSIDKGLELGARAALNDLPRSGKPKSITAAAESWLVAEACRKPVDVGYSYELWTVDLLSRHAREQGPKQGHESLQYLARGTVSKILNAHDIKPHKIQYYLERRDPDFDAKMTQVLYVYQEVEVLRKRSGDQEQFTAYISYDEKPGIQALSNVAPDLPPKPGSYSCVGRDYEYVRHGTLSLLAGIDLMSGEVIGLVEEQHTSKEFIKFLKRLDERYADKKQITVVLDNHSAHVSKETRKYLSTTSNRFRFVFTPKHASWLNLIEHFFSKLSRTVLRQIRVSSAEALRQRIFQYLDEINQSPKPFRWKYKLDTLDNSVTD